MRRGSSARSMYSPAGMFLLAQRAQAVEPRQEMGDEGDVAGAALVRVVLDDRTGAEVAAHPVEHGEQLPIAGGRRHRRHAVEEGDRAAAVCGEERADDGAHPPLGAFALLGGQEAQVALDDRRRRHDVVLAGGAPRSTLGGQLGGRAADHDARIEGQVGLGQLAAEGGEDARHLEDRAVAALRTEDARRVPGRTGGLEPPRRRCRGARRPPRPAPSPRRPARYRSAAPPRPAPHGSPRAARPAFSSSPVSTTITWRPASSPSAASARSASTMTTSPPFMSETPLP